jgi:predicted deacylase
VQKNRISAIALLIVVAVVMAIIIPQYKSMATKTETIQRGPGVTDVQKLSKYFDGIKDTNGDTDVYFLDSGKPGGTIFIMGGTHANEPSGFTSAILMIENLQPTEGRMIIIPIANQSAMTHTDAGEGSPYGFNIETPNGPRYFRYGSRATNPIDQWPDPDVYIHASSGQKLSGSEVRNLNRAHPGRPDGNLTEKVTYAMAQLIREEKVDIAIDLHEASPEYPVINAIVAHDRAMPVAAEVVMNLELDDGMSIGLEPSPVNLRGLTHREWGDHTEAIAILMESANPAQGRIRGKTDEALIVTGKDKMYARVAPSGVLFVPWDEEIGWPLSTRVARHVSAIKQIMNVYTSQNPENPMVAEFPSYESISTDIGQYLGLE